jgi:uncharacterized damage-inducible protein DinB
MMPTKHLLRSPGVPWHAVFALAILAPTVARCAETPHVPGLRGEVIANLHDAEQKVEELAGAVPALKYAWRPAKGVRSVAEVYLHIAGGNYLFGAALGGTPPLSMEQIGRLEKEPADRARVAQLLKDSYAFAMQSIADTPDTELGTPVTLFGQRMSKREVMLEALSHSHEHLGQSVAYARMNAVVPPWTARENASAAAAPAAGH